MIWWKKYLFIEEKMASNHMFVTMSCFSDFSLLLTYKICNYAAATALFILTITGEPISFDMMISWDVYNYIFRIKNNHEGLTEWALAPLGLSIIPTHVLNHQTFATKLLHQKRFKFYSTLVPLKQNLITIHL